MKKISFFVAIAAAASLASCTAQAPKANMKNDVDSLSYMMGITNTQGLDMYMSQQLGVDTAYMADFIRGIVRLLISASSAWCSGHFVSFCLSVAPDLPLSEKKMFQKTSLFSILAITGVISISSSPTHAVRA